MLRLRVASGLPSWFPPIFGAMEAVSGALVLIYPPLGLPLGVYVASFDLYVILARQKSTVRAIIPVVVLLMLFTLMVLKLPRETWEWLGFDSSPQVPVGDLIAFHGRMPVIILQFMGGALALGPLAAYLVCAAFGTKPNPELAESLAFGARVGDGSRRSRRGASAAAAAETQSSVVGATAEASTARRRRQ